VLSFIQHIVLSSAMHYNSIFAYNSVKKLEKLLDENDEKILNSQNKEEEQENILDFNFTLNNKNNENQQLEEEKEFLQMENFLQKMQRMIKEKSKSEINFAAKLNQVFHLICLVAVLVCIGCFVVLKQQNIYILFAFDLFMLYYSCLIYYHFSQNSTTLMRNCTTSVMFVSICFITIAQNFVNFNIS